MLAKGYADNKEQRSKYLVVRILADFVKRCFDSKRPLNRHPVSRRRDMIISHLFRCTVTAVRRQVGKYPNDGIFAPLFLVVGVERSACRA